VLGNGNEVEVKLPGRLKVSPQMVGATKAATRHCEERSDDPHHEDHRDFAVAVVDTVARAKTGTAHRDEKDRAKAGGFTGRYTDFPCHKSKPRDAGVVEAAGLQMLRRWGRRGSFGDRRGAVARA
jgi:hypothetical protein